MALEEQKQDQARQRHHDDAGFRRAIVDPPWFAGEGLRR
jgi:hypothetical protein